MLKLPAAGSWRCKTLEGASFEYFEAPPNSRSWQSRAARAMGITLAGLDILPTEDGYIILEVNPIPACLNIFGRERHQQTLQTASSTGWRSTPAEQQRGRRAGDPGGRGAQVRHRVARSEREAGHRDGAAAWVEHSHSPQASANVGDREHVISLGPHLAGESTGTIPACG